MDRKSTMLVEHTFPPGARVLSRVAEEACPEETCVSSELLKWAHEPNAGPRSLRFCER